MKQSIALFVLMLFVQVSTVAAADINDILQLIDDQIGGEIYTDYYSDDSTYIEELQDAVERGYDQWLTKFDDIVSFEYQGSLTREAAAKFYAEFAKLILDTTESSSYSCSFSDSSSMHSGLKPYITSACRMGLFKWSNGQYLPKEALTNGQALVVLVKSLDWVQTEIAGAHFAKPYLNAAKSLDLTNWTAAASESKIDWSATRGDIMLMMYRAAKNLGQVE